MKYQAFFLTFFLYVGIHLMRVIYSFIKTQFKQEYQLSNLYLGFIDGMVYISLGIGFILRIVITKKQSFMRNYFLFIQLTAIMFLVIPLCSLFKIGVTQDNGWIKVVFFISMTLFGFFQLAAYPASLIIINDYFNQKKQGGIIGLWSTSGDVGNILGFVLGTILLNNLNVKWEVLMLIASWYTMIFNLLVFLLVNRKQKNEKEEDTQFDRYQQENEDDTNISLDELIQTTRNYMKKLYFIFYLLATCLFKAIIYSLLLWLPAYFNSINMKELAGYGPSFMCVCGIIGSYIFGRFYQKSDGEEGAFKRYFMFIFSLIVPVSFLLLYLIAGQITIQLLIMGLVGFVKGGIFNNLLGNQILKLGANRSRNVNLISTIVLSLCNIFTGIVQIIIGGLIGQGNGVDVYKKIFFILFFVSLLSCVSLYLKIYFEGKQRQEKKSH